MTPALPCYGRGRRETAFLSVRAPVDSPISASSAAALTIVPTSSVPENGAGRRAGGAGGLPAGCLGWLIDSARGLRAGALRFALWRAAGRDFGVAVRGEPAPARLLLRRWGRLFGSDPRISGGRSSLMART